MSNLENFILPVTYNNWNSYSYSGTTEHIMSFSYNAGCLPVGVTDMFYSRPNYVFDKLGQPTDRKELKHKLSDIDKHETLEEELENYLQQFVDVENEPLLDSNFLLTLPHAFRHSKVGTLDIKKISPMYRGAKWLGILETQLDNPYSTAVHTISYGSKSHEIDHFFNEKIDDYVNLSNSDNYLKSIIEFILDKTGETLSVNIDTAVEYFNDKPYDMLFLALEYGIGPMMDWENAYKLYKDRITDFQCEVKNKEDTYGVSVRLFYFWEYQRSLEGYLDFCNYTELDPNFELYEQWHNWMHEGISSPEHSVVNTIAKLSTGQEFREGSWNMFQQAITDYAAEEKFNTNGESLLKKWINRRD